MPISDCSDENLARIFVGTTSPLDLQDVLRIVEKLKYTEHAHSALSAYDSVIHAFLMMQFDIEKAVPHLEAFMASPVSNEWFAYDVLFELANMQWELKRIEDFLSVANKLLSIDNSRPEAHNLLGVYHFKQIGAAKAIPMFEAAAASARPNVPYQLNDSYYTWLPYEWLGAAYDSRGDYEKAVEMYWMALTAGGPQSEGPKERMTKKLHQLIDRALENRK